jgi:regulator of cell morphogenesis and NO signaling
MLDANRTVRDFAIESPGATRIFEKLKIDYCCGGNKPLADACAASGLDVELVLRELGAAGSQVTAGGQSPSAESLSATELVNYIIEKHHNFTRHELTRLGLLFDKVSAAHGVNHPDVLRLQNRFKSLAAELEPHMMREERVLFPFISRLEAACAENRPAPPAVFGSVAHPIRMMMLEHEDAGELMREMRALSKDFSAPADACISFQTLYRALAELEADLHQHIHLENNILFPKAVAMENQAATAIEG